MKNIDLFIFLKSPENLTEEHISSLQAFETSLLMAMHDRWISSVISITNAIETMLRANYEGSNDLLQMIDFAINDRLISPSLGDRAHEIRKQRNKFIHNMVAPADTPQAAYTYIFKAIPLYRQLVKKSLNECDIFEICENQALGLIYAITRDNALREVKRKDQEISIQWLSTFKKTIANSIYFDWSPLWVREKLADWDRRFKRHRFPKEIDVIMSKYKSISEINGTILSEYNDDMVCPASPCTGHLVLEVVDHMDRENFIEPINLVARARCPLCDLSIEDTAQLQGFVAPQLSTDWIYSQFDLFFGEEPSCHIP